MAKAGAHSLTQGVMSFMQGGNFWGGALSGVFTSVSNDLLGLATDNLGNNNILKSDGFALFNGAVSGGVGSVLGGGNFWMGAGQGLIVAAFNYLEHKVAPGLKKQKTFYEKFKTALDAFGLNTATKEVILDLVKNADDLGTVGAKFKNIVSKLGNGLGIANIVTAGIDYIQDPTTAAFIKLIVNVTALSVATFATGAAATSSIGWLLSFSDASGFSDFVYGELGSSFDKYFYKGKSFGKALYKNIQNVINPIINNFNLAH